MESKLKNLKKSMTTTVLEDMVFDRSLELKIKEKMERDNRSHFRRRVTRLSWSIAIPAILFTAFVLSANVSPAVASVIEKIPYLNTLFTQPSMEEKLAAPLQEKGFNIKGINVRALQNDVLIVVLGSNEYLEGIKEEVIAITESTLRAEDYDKYDVTVKAYMEPFQELTDHLNSELSKQNFDIHSLLVTDDEKGNKVIRVEIPHTENRTAFLEESILHMANESQKEKFLVKIHKVNVAKVEQENRWAIYIASPLNDQLTMDKEFKVKSVSYTVNPSPKLMIHTLVSASEPESKSYAEQLQKRITEMLESDEMKEYLKDDSYEIEIYSKEDKLINR
ncbi:DUF4030 domain-containing protein [Bacillus sp. 31A1R]|uniref:DUF4030 domain-containing protein n=1 Tax=Robertmurraya mangrovi TaxID=3098077 RepID=A0ABU5IX55_9BACI|nr:DUF4030 domain-containing protein [Bacillus sp. 31A1R]MDZ5471748.1 DUF4030 domain-containing protein [Bacillus sp. 31A1R]